MKRYEQELRSYMQELRVINTHSHRGRDPEFENYSLETLLNRSYVSWLGVPFGRTKESREQYLKKVRYNSYFVWLQRSLQELYGIEEALSAENWDEYSRRIREAYQNKEHHLGLLKDKCRYEKIILDTYWEPGSDNKHPEIFTPTFRINMFLYGYSKTARDHNGNNPLILYGRDIKDIDEYIDFVREIISRKKQEGCVALKSAVAYDRGLDFQEVSKEKAQLAFKEDGKRPEPDEIKAFQDYVFYQICKIAAELDLPIQIHTGLGKLEKTNAMQMQEVISKNPGTKFVLFHGSYPWMDDINGLLHLYPNVYPDLCWLPLISTSACERMLDELIEVGTADKVCWGCDTWTSEESYGALLAMEHVLSKVLARKIEDGYLSPDDAREIIANILYNNAKGLYKL